MTVTIVGHYGVATSAGDQYPGDVVTLPDAEAKRLIARGRAVEGGAAQAAPAPTPPGVVETRDPAPVARRRK